MRGAFSSIGTVIGWLVLIAIVFAIMTIWNWDPIAFLTSAVSRISDLFLSWDWFRKLVGSE